MAFAAQAKTLQQFVGSAFGFPWNDAEIFRLINQQLIDSQKRVEIRFLGAQADEPAGVKIFTIDVITEYFDGPALIIGKSGQAIDGGGFAGAVGPEKGEEIPAFDFKGDIV